MPGDIGLTATEKWAGAGPKVCPRPCAFTIPRGPSPLDAVLGSVLVTAPTEASWPPCKVDLIIPSTDEEIKTGGKGRGWARPEARTPPIPTPACCLLSLNRTWDSFRDPPTSLEGSRGCSGKEPGHGQPRMEAREPREEPGLCSCSQVLGLPPRGVPFTPATPRACPLNAQA